MPKITASLLKTCGQRVFWGGKTRVQGVGLYHRFLPTKISAVNKWVAFASFYPLSIRLVFPTHFYAFTSVNNLFYTLSTGPTTSNYHVNNERKGV
jgi:hypothetical protein